MVAFTKKRKAPTQATLADLFGDEAGLDGNGRIGRLLIAAFLEQWGLLPQPLLILSSYLKQHQVEYYRCLSAVRTDGDWEGWATFFLDGVETAATNAERGIVAIASLVAADRRRLLAAPARRRDGLASARVAAGHAAVHHRTGAPESADDLSHSHRRREPSRGTGIVAELTGQKKNRSYGYRAYVDVLSR